MIDLNLDLFKSPSKRKAIRTLRKLMWEHHQRTKNPHEAGQYFRGENITP